MTHLAGKFAGVVAVAVAEAQRASLVEALAGLASQGLTAVVEASDVEAPSAAPIVRLELVGQDRPGIVRDVSRVLAALGVNVEELETDCASAPMSGEALFRAVAALRLPPALDAADLRRSLEELANDLMVEVTLDEGDADERAAR
jgi:glycine cleavage system regulatory protein